MEAAKAMGCSALGITPGLDAGLDGELAPTHLETLPNLAAVVYWGEATKAKAMRQALAARTGPIIPLITERDMATACQVERHLCIDTTAAGGNASLLADMAD